MKVLAVTGSPRKGGNTDTLVAELLCGAQSAGAEVEQVNLARLKIKGCVACDTCKKTGHCKQHDDRRPCGFDWRDHERNRTWRDVHFRRH